VIVVAGIIIYNSLTLKPNEELTAEEVANFLDIHYWYIPIPPECKNGYAIKFYLQIRKEKITKIAGWSVRGSSFKFSKIKLFYANLGNDKYKLSFSATPNDRHKLFSWLSTNFSLKRYNLEHTCLLCLLNNGNEIKPNKIFLNFNCTDSINDNSELKDGGCGLYYEITPL
jgi:hypothetical protein